MKKSAGILLFRKSNNEIEFFMVHPGGPFWRIKDQGAWTIPKGEFTDDELPLDAAIREFKEETGFLPEGDFIELSPVRQKSGKLVYAWAIEGDLDETKIQSNSFQQEWPYKSGKWQSFPEVDKAGWFNYEKASALINPAQITLLQDLIHKLQ